MDPWKKILCDSPKCIDEMMDFEYPGSRNSKLNGNTVGKYFITPDYDSESEIKFTCPRCGKVTVWGPLRINVAKSLYSRMIG